MRAARLSGGTIQLTFGIPEDAIFSIGNLRRAYAHVYIMSVISVDLALVYGLCGLVARPAVEQANVTP